MAENEREHKRLDPRWVLRKLYQRPGQSRFWYGHLRDEREGKDYWRSTGETSKRKAEQAMLAFKRELEAQEQGQVKGARFDLAFTEYLSLKNIRESTRGDYTCTFNAIFKPHFGDLFVSDISVKTVEHFFKNLDTERKISPRTKQKYLTELRAFLRWAKRREYIKKDPTEGLKVGRIPKRFGVALTLEQTQALLQACQEPLKKIVKYSNRASAEQSYQPPTHLLTSLLIALHTGLRRGNITSLRWSHIELANRRIFIEGEEMKSHNDFETAIHPELAEVLTNLLREKGQIRPNDFVLGQEFSEIKKSFKTALKKANLPDIRWHDLRHTFATWVGQIAPFVVYRALLGHSPGNVSERYFHPPLSELKKVIDSLPRLLTPPSLKQQDQQLQAQE